MLKKIANLIVKFFIFNFKIVNFVYGDYKEI